jgi:hypothetical protein
MRCSRCKGISSVAMTDTHYECDCGHKWPIFPYDEPGAMRDAGGQRKGQLSFKSCNLVTPNAKGHF